MIKHGRSVGILSYDAKTSDTFSSLMGRDDISVMTSLMGSIAIRKHRGLSKWRVGNVISLPIWWRRGEERRSPLFYQVVKRRKEERKGGLRSALAEGGDVVLAEDNINK